MKHAEENSCRARVALRFVIARTLVARRRALYNFARMSSTPTGPFSAGFRPDQWLAILDCVTDAIITVDRDYRITSFNRAAEQLVGVFRAQALGRPCCEVLRCLDCGDEQRCPLAPVLRDGAPHALRDVRLPGEPQATRAVCCTTQALRDDQGRVIGCVQTMSLRPTPVPAADRPLGPLESSQRQAIAEVLRRCGGNRAAACAELGLSRSTLWRKMRQYGLDTPPAGQA